MPTQPELASMSASSEIVVNVLKSLANPDRLSILCHLAEKELNVSQIEVLTEIKQPTLSQQLMMLRNVVCTRRAGKQIFYSLKDNNLLTVLNTLQQLYYSE
jgi:DNA-binding transcriptional ArsR family regulator